VEPDPYAETSHPTIYKPPVSDEEGGGLSDRDNVSLDKVPEYNVPKLEQVKQTPSSPMNNSGEKYTTKDGRIGVSF
jgi:hypothetical protein